MNENDWIEPAHAQEVRRELQTALSADLAALTQTQTQVVGVPTLLALVAELRQLAYRWQDEGADLMHVQGKAELGQLRMAAGTELLALLDKHTLLGEHGEDG